MRKIMFLTIAATVLLMVFLPFARLMDYAEATAAAPVKEAPAEVKEYRDEPLPTTVWAETETEEAPESAEADRPYPWRRDDVPLSLELQDVLFEACEAAGIEYALGLGLIDGESTFRENAISSSGCYGLCQLNPRFFPADLSPADNIRTGIAYLGEQIARYGGDVDAGLTAYNVGHDNGIRGYASYIKGKAEKWRDK